MYRMLILEDQRHTREQLAMLLKEKLPDPISNHLQIDQAEYAEDACVLVDQAIADGRPYAVAILDFRVQARPGAPHGIDVTVCDQLSRRMPETFIIHFTGYPSDGEVQAFLVTERAKRRDRGLTDLVTKDASGHVLELVQAYLQGEANIRVRERIDGYLRSILGEADQDQSAPEISVWASHRGGACLSHQLPALKRDLVENWDILPWDLRERARRIFRVEETDNGTEITLI